MKEGKTSAGHEPEAVLEGPPDAGSPAVDVAIVGGGPAGLAAALALGRAGRRAVLFDAGAPRNAAAHQVHNFVTRDGIPPAEFRRAAREQLARYPSVEMRDLRVLAIAGERGAFAVATPAGSWRSRRVILCAGVQDEMLDIPGFREAWGHSIFQCPYCHGWEVKGQRWGFLALDVEALEHGFPAVLANWTDDVVVFTASRLDVPPAIVERLQQRGIRFESRLVRGLAVEESKLKHVELEDGERVPCEALFARPGQSHVELVRALGLKLDAQGNLEVDPMTRQTSRPGIYAAGDLTTRAQGAIFVAASGTQAAASVNHDLSWNET